jgi:hypothetical protein
MSSEEKTSNEEEEDEEATVPAQMKVSKSTLVL